MSTMADSPDRGLRIDPVGVSVAWVAMGIGLVGTLAPQPFPAVWGLLVTAGGLAVLARGVGGGRAGALAGIDLGLAVLVPCLSPWAYRVAQSGFLQAPGTPAWGGALDRAERMYEMVGAHLWAMILVALVGPLVCGGVAWVPRSRPGTSDRLRREPTWELVQVFSGLVFGTGSLVLFTLQFGRTIAAARHSIDSGSSAILGYVSSLGALLVLGVFSAAVCALGLVSALRARPRWREILVEPTPWPPLFFMPNWPTFVVGLCAGATVSGPLASADVLETGGVIGLSSAHTFDSFTLAAFSVYVAACLLLLAAERVVHRAFRRRLSRPSPP